MINLLPPEERAHRSFARKNSWLRRWLTASFMGLVVLWLLALVGWVLINKSINNINRQNAATQEQLKVQKIDQTRTRIEDLSSNIKLATQVLGREVLFSKLLQQIGAVMPSGSSLAGLSISKTQGAIDLNAVAKDYNTASQIQVNLQDPNNKIFEKADIISTNCVSGTPDPDYACTIGLKALFAKDNPFLFINPTTAVKTP